MAGQAQRGSRGHGRSSRGASSWSRVALAAGATPATAVVQPASIEPSLPASSPTTRATYRTLILRGLTADEASNLTAFLCGIPVTDHHWNLGEVNRLLFIRALARSGRFGERDGAPH
jgi:hypothetical protein